MTSFLLDRTHNHEPALCMTCDGSGELGEARDWQSETCEDCNGTGYSPDVEYTHADYLADQADAANDDAWCHGEVL
jgi:RecJ-like exonuclease